MARPRKFTEPRVTTAIRLPEELHAQLEATADERGTSINHLLIKAAEFYLRNLPPLTVPDIRLADHPETKVDFG